MHVRTKLLICTLTLALSLNVEKANSRQGTSNLSVSNAPDDTITQQSNKQFRYSLSAMAIGTSNKQVPFWMRSNQFGSIPLKGSSFSLIGSIGREYSKNRKNKLTDWGVYLEPRFNVGRTSELVIIEGYAKVRLGILQLKAGRSRDIIGLVDSTLSTGSFSVSGNSLGIPKVEISIPEFWDLPFLRGVIAVKGNYAHGWLGNVDVHSNFVQSATTYFHQKSFYARFGKPTWKLNFFGGFNHQVFWGNEQEMNGPKYKLSVLDTYKYVVFGKGYGGEQIGLPRSKVGNHLGSIDQAFQYNGKNIQILAYHQFLYDVGGLYHLNNIKDGIFGISLTNKKFLSSQSQIRLKKVLFEYVNTRSQGGEADAKITPSGDEDYYNNYIYDEGWTYNHENIGNPLVTSILYARKELPAADEFFSNNRLQAFQLGSEFSIQKYNLLLKLTHSLNYGTYGTSPLGHSLNDIRIPSKPPYFELEKQFSGYIEVNRKLKKGMQIGLSFAVDSGTMLYNSTGGWLSFTKFW